MITLKKIKQTVEEVVTIGLPQLQLLPQKPTEALEATSIYIELDNIIKNNRLYNYERSLTVRIYIYPSNTTAGMSEALEAIEGLEELFQLTMKIEDRSIKILETSSKLVDGVFQFEFNVNYFEAKEETDDNELMQNIKLK